jgi:cation:H+ antiporter
MIVVIDLTIMALGAVLLLYGADWFLDGVRDLSRLLGVSALVLGVLLVGLEPEEMLTAAIASARGSSTLAINNVVGVNVTIITCALGLSALLCPIYLGRPVRRQALLATLISLLPIALLFSGMVSRLAGLFLLALFAVYTFFLWRQDHTSIEHTAELEADDDENEGRVGKSLRRWQLFGLTLLGLVGMSGGGYLLVEGAERLVSATGLGEGVVGATLISLATGAEMIALAVKAAHKQQSEVLVGGILGSFAYNLLVTLGLAAVIHPLAVDLHQTLVALGMMIITHLVLLLLIWRGAISRIMGGLFMLAYVAYLMLVVLVHP